MLISETCAATTSATPTQHTTLMAAVQTNKVADASTPTGVPKKLLRRKTVSFCGPHDCRTLADGRHSFNLRTQSNDSALIVIQQSSKHLCHRMSHRLTNGGPTVGLVVHRSLSSDTGHVVALNGLADCVDNGDSGGGNLCRRQDSFVHRNYIQNRSRAGDNNHNDYGNDGNDGDDCDDDNCCFSANERRKLSGTNSWRDDERGRTVNGINVGTAATAAAAAANHKLPLSRQTSLPATVIAAFKRDSYFRKSWHNLWRRSQHAKSNSDRIALDCRHSESDKHTLATSANKMGKKSLLSIITSGSGGVVCGDVCGGGFGGGVTQNFNYNNDNNNSVVRTTEDQTIVWSRGAVAATPDGHAAKETRAATAKRKKSSAGKDTAAAQSAPAKAAGGSFFRLGHRRNSSNSSGLSSRSTTSIGLGTRSASASPMAGPLHAHSDASNGNSVGSLSGIGKSPAHHSLSSKGDTKSIKQLTTSAPVAVAHNPRSVSPHPVRLAKNEASEKEKDDGKKEKKKKELSSSRQKKFFRHFDKVPLDEKVLNYFSCALVSDILLQGHLYITENYLAFYSNVFGFVTKLLIPTVSVVRISKEKTAKIIPNAVGVATADERHVFGSFISREAAYRLMLSVCPSPIVAPEQLPPKIVPDVEISECSIEDDSSCSQSGNESPPSQLLQTKTIGGVLTPPKSLISGNISTSTSSPGGDDGGICSSGGRGGGDGSHVQLRRRIVATEVDGDSNTSPTTFLENSAQTTESTALSSRFGESTARFSAMSRTFEIKFPTNFHVIYVGIGLAIVLTIFSCFLLYRILAIQARTANMSPIDFNWDVESDDVLSEFVKWQREMHTKSADDVHTIVNTNLEQLAKVRKSLETLSMLIHGKNTMDDSGVGGNVISSGGGGGGDDSST